MASFELSETVFSNAAALRRAYQQALSRAGHQANKRTPKDQMRAAKKQLAWLNSHVLFKLTPEAFRELLPLEITKERTDRDNVVTHRLLEYGGESLEGAKQLAHLFIHNTLFYTRAVNAPESAEAPWSFLHTCFLARFFHTSGYFKNAKVIPIGFGFITQLMRGAERGDGEARQYLRLLYRALLDWGIDLQPVPQHDYNEAHHQQFERCLDTPERTAAHPVRCPLACSRTDYQILQAVRAEEDEVLAANDEAVNRLYRRLREVLPEAYEHYLSAVWVQITTEQLPHLVLSGGRDKVAIDIPAIQAMGPLSFAFVREQMPPAHGWRPYPAIGVDLFWQQLCEHQVDHAGITQDGQTIGIDYPAWPWHIKAMMWCLIMDAYAEIVLAKQNAHHNPGHVGQFRLQRIRRRAGETVPVHPHFRRLAAKWKASQEQIDLAVELTGKPPQTGYTFVGEFDRSFPGVALPVRVPTDQWQAHRSLKPVLRYSEPELDALLDDIKTYTPAP